MEPGAICTARVEWGELAASVLLPLASCFWPHLCTSSHAAARGELEDLCAAFVRSVAPEPISWSAMLLRRTAPLLHRAAAATRLPRAATQAPRTLATTADTRPPARKASALLGQLQQEALAKVHRPWPDFKAGDAIEMEILVDMDAPKPQKVKGLVLGRRNRGADSSVQLFCRVMGTPMRRHVPLYSPLVKSITVLQKAWLTKGKKRVKRRNLDYLWKQGKTFRVP